MKILNLRKYFFANITVLWTYYFIVMVALYFKNLCHKIDSEVSGIVAIFVFWVIIISALVLICIFIFMVFEILIRKFIIEKNFPNFKINFKFKIPKVIVAIYNIIFSIGFSMASVMFVIALFCLIYFAIDTLQPLFG